MRAEHLVLRPIWLAVRCGTQGRLPPEHAVSAGRAASAPEQRAYRPRRNAKLLSGRNQFGLHPAGGCRNILSADSDRIIRAGTTRMRCTGPFCIRTTANQECRFMPYFLSLRCRVRMVTPSVSAVLPFFQLFCSRASRMRCISIWLLASEREPSVGEC